VDESGVDARADALRGCARDLRRDSWALREQSSDVRTFARELLVELRTQLDRFADRLAKRF